MDRDARIERMAYLISASGGERGEGAVEGYVRLARSELGADPGEARSLVSDALAYLDLREADPDPGSEASRLGIGFS